MGEKTRTDLNLIFRDSYYNFPFSILFPFLCVLSLSYSNLLLLVNCMYSNLGILGSFIHTFSFFFCAHFFFSSTNLDPITIYCLAEVKDEKLLWLNYVSLKVKSNPSQLWCYTNLMCSMKSKVNPKCNLIPKLNSICNLSLN